MQPKYIYYCRVKDKKTGFYSEMYLFKPKGKVIFKEVYRFKESGLC